MIVGKASQHLENLRAATDVRTPLIWAARPAHSPSHHGRIVNTAVKRIPPRSILNGPQ